MKILYVTTILNTVNAFLIPHIGTLIEQGHKVDVASNAIQSDNAKLLELGCEIYNVPFQRSPLKKDNINAYKQIKKIIFEKKYDVVHTHTPIASTITRLACKNIKNTKVFYTAHGFHFFKGAPIINWLLYYPVERLLARYTDVLITINKEDYNRAKRFKAKKVIYVPGVGLDISKFRDLLVDKSQKRKGIGVPDDSFVLLSVGELNKNKNHEVIIKAVAKLNNHNIYYLICGQGPLENYLKQTIIELNIEKQVKLLGFRKDINEIYKAADVFVFPSYREGLPVSLMEAMASGLPVICSNIRGNTDLIEDGKGGYLVVPNDINGWSASIRKMISQNNKSMNDVNIQNIQKFDLNHVLKQIKSVYSEINI